jgi:hypothetical protein
MYPLLQTLFADAGYQGQKFHNTLKTILPHLQTQIVKRSDQAKGFVVLPKRRAHVGVAQPLPKARQGLGEPQPRSARVLAPRLHPPHAPQTLQSSLMFPDRL